MAYTVGLVYLALMMLYKLTSALIIAIINATLVIVIVAAIIAAKGEKRKNE